LGQPSPVFIPPFVEDVSNIAVVTAFCADFAILPLKWLAGHSADAAELTFCAGGRLA
jgi:hypothetical protein